MGPPINRQELLAINKANFLAKPPWWYRCLIALGLK